MLWIVVSRFSFVLSFPAFFGSHLSLLSAMKTMRIPFYRQFSDVDTVLSCLVFFFVREIAFSVVYSSARKSRSFRSSPFFSFFPLSLRVRL